MTSFEDNFMHYYQSQMFKDTETDPFISSSIKRKCLSQLYVASFNLASNDTSCLLLEEKMFSYASLVDKRDEEAVNNYAKSALALATHCKKETQQWKSGLEDAKTTISKYLKPVKCELATDSVPNSCTSWETTEKDISLLFSARTQSNKVASKENCHILPDRTVLLPCIAESSTFSYEKGHIPGRVPTTNIFQTNNVRKEQPNNGVTNHCQINNVRRDQPNQLLHRPFTNSDSITGLDQQDWPRSNMIIGTTAYRKKADHEQVSASTSLFKKSAQMNAHNLHPPVQLSEQETGGRGNNMFRTARNELSIQNTKKWGNRGSSANCYSVESGMNYNYGGQKRSLGTRRGVMNKFVPPVRSNMEDNFDGAFGGNGKEGEWEQNEEIDERLKNIEPKMIELIRNEIMDNGTTVTWDDIAGLEFAKSTIQEVVVWPLLRPDIFTGLRRPPKGILLFGPPGTGKTLIGKCIASQSHSTFFSISASSLTSKWIGDGEKMVRALFAVARCHQPAVVFIDEIDSLLTQRSDTEHESSRRIKTEFLVQLDGAATGEEDRILVIGATNRPQELDEAARRRLVKKLYIPLPELEARHQIVERLMCDEKHCLTDQEVNEISLLTAGYSGADMKNLCQEASLGPIRSLGFIDIQHIRPDQVRPVTINDFKSALTRVRASVSPGDLDNYVAWDKLYGSGGVAVNGP